MKTLLKLGLGFGLFLLPLMSRATDVIPAAPSGVNVGSLNPNNSAQVHWNDDLRSTYWYILLNGAIRYSPANNQCGYDASGQRNYTMFNMPTGTASVVITLETTYGGGGVESVESNAVTLTTGTSGGGYIYVRTDPAFPLSISSTGGGTGTTVNQGTNPWVVSGNVNATQSGSWSMGITQSGPLTVSGSVQVSNTSGSPIPITATGSGLIVIGAVTINSTSTGLAVSISNTPTVNVYFPTTGLAVNVSNTPTVNISTISSNALSKNISAAVPVNYGLMSATASLSATGQYTIMNTWEAHSVVFSLTGTAWNDAGGAAVIALVSNDGNNWATVDVYDQKNVKQTGGINHTNCGNTVWHVSSVGAYLALSVTSLTGGQISVTAEALYTPDSPGLPQIVTMNGGATSNGETGFDDKATQYRFSNSGNQALPIRAAANRTNFTNVVVGSQQGAVILTPTASTKYHWTGGIISTDTTGLLTFFDSAGATLTSFWAVSFTPVPLNDAILGESFFGSANNATVNVTHSITTAKITGHTSWDTH
jgi:hypothetical protein